MTITTVKGDALEVTDKSEWRYLLHGVNCQGVMGAGIALTIKNKFPKVHEEYRALSEFGGLKLGTIQCVNVEDENKFFMGLTIVNAATQYDTGGRSRGEPDVDYDAIRTCFRQINVQAFMDRRTAHEMGMKISPVISFPLIGCGLAGGDWNIVSKIIEEEISDEFEKRLYVL